MIIGNHDISEITVYICDYDAYMEIDKTLMTPGELQGKLEQLVLFLGSALYTDNSTGVSSIWSTPIPCSFLSSTWMLRMPASLCVIWKEKYKECVYVHSVPGRFTWSICAEGGMGQRQYCL